MDADNRFERVRAAIEQLGPADHACTLYDERDEEVAISAEHGTLQGPLTVKTTKGIATFTSLSIGTAEASTRLLARAALKRAAS